MATVHRFDTAAERRRWERFYAGRFRALLAADPNRRSPRDVADAHPALTRSSVEELRRGMANPPFELIASVAEVLGVDIAYFSTTWPVEDIDSARLRPRPDLVATASRLSELSAPAYTALTRTIDILARDRRSAHQRQQEDGQYVDEFL